MNITPLEEKALDLSKDLFNCVNEMPKSHEDGGGVNDMQEFVYHIHAIQNYILSRATLRTIRNVHT